MQFPSTASGLPVAGDVASRMCTDQLQAVMRDKKAGLVLDWNGRNEKAELW